MAVSDSEPIPQEAAKPQPIVLVRPPKKISEMTEEELDEFARKIWRAVKESGTSEPDKLSAEG